MKTEVTLAILTTALEEIARQKLHAEITDCDPDELDFRNLERRHYEPTY
jgi:hypothetical protein